MPLVKKNIHYFFLFVILISCSKNYNNDKINVLSELEKITKNDINALYNLDLEDAQHTLQIAKFNLLKIEDKKLDSMEFELIYFEYRNYLHCINKLYESMQSITPLKKILSKNQSQLKNIKSDYKNSKDRRSDLDQHLLQEKKIVEETSMQVSSIISSINEEKVRFKPLNNRIEEIIN